MPNYDDLTSRITNSFAKGSPFKDNEIAESLLSSITSQLTSVTLQCDNLKASTEDATTLETIKRVIDDINRIGAVMVLYLTLLQSKRT